MLKCPFCEESREPAYRKNYIVCNVICSHADFGILITFFKTVDICVCKVFVNFCVK